jgi:predicted cytidylate kinase
MIVVFAGLHGTGKSTIAKQVAQKINATFYSTGMAFRDLAKEKNMSLEEFSKYSEQNLDVDKELDQKTYQIAQTGQNYVFDGQLPAYILKELSNFNIMLKCDEIVRIERMAKRDGRSFDAQRHETLVREESERQRFIRLYQIDILDPLSILNTYHLILDTNKLGIEEIVAICTHAVETKSNWLKK